MNQLSFSHKDFNKNDEIPVVLLHGFLESSTMWKYVEFPEDYPQVRIDLPGHGKSIHPELLVNSMEEMADAVIQVIDELELTRFHIIGHSMGGYVSLEIVKNDPRAQKMMLLNSNFWSDSPQKVIDRLRVVDIVQTNKSHFIYEVIPNLFLNPEAHDSDVKSLISEATKMTPEAIAKSSIAMSKRKDFTEFVRENSTRLRCVQGIEDRIVPLKQMRNLLKSTDVNCVEWEDVGHMAHIEAPKKLRKEISDFLLEQKKTET